MKLNNNKINLIDVKLNFKKPFGKISNKSSKYIKECFKVAIEIMRKKLGFALINGPISKKHFFHGKYNGITEYLSNKTNNSGNEVMLIYNKSLSVCPVTTHIPVKYVSKKISTKSGLMKKESKRLYKKYDYVRKNKMPYIIGKLACSSNFYILKNNKPITNDHSRKISHLLRYQNQGILTSCKTINSDNPKLNCRINGLEKFSPTRLIIDKDLKTNMNSYIIRSSINFNTIIFHNTFNKKKINLLKQKKIKLIFSDLNNYGVMDLKFIFKKIYENGIHNILVECGSELTSSILKEKLFNEFYLFKSNNKIINKDRVDVKIININLKKIFKNKKNINTYLDKDSLIHYY